MDTIPNLNLIPEEKLLKSNLCVKVRLALFKYEISLFSNLVVLEKLDVMARMWSMCLEVSGAGHSQEERKLGTSPTPELSYREAGMILTLAEL